MSMISCEEPPFVEKLKRMKQVQWNTFKTKHVSLQEKNTTCKERIAGIHRSLSGVVGTFFEFCWALGELELQDDDSPLYLFDHCFGEYPSTRALLDQYDVPKIFGEELLGQGGSLCKNCQFLRLSYVSVNR